MLLSGHFFTVMTNPRICVMSFDVDILMQTNSVRIDGNFSKLA